MPKLTHKLCTYCHILYCQYIITRKYIKNATRCRDSGTPKSR